MVLNVLAFIFLLQGIGNSIAEWKPCFLALSGLYLYVSESEVSQNYQRCSRHVFVYVLFSIGGFLLLLVGLSSSLIFHVIEYSVFGGFFKNIFLIWTCCEYCSMAGRHVFEVSPTSIGGSLFSVAVCFRGDDIQKVSNVRYLGYMHTDHYSFFFFFW